MEYLLNHHERMKSFQGLTEDLPGHKKILQAMFKAYQEKNPKDKTAAGTFELLMKNLVVNQEQEK